MKISYFFKHYLFETPQSARLAGRIFGMQMTPGCFLRQENVTSREGFRKHPERYLANMVPVIGGF
jgi:hypothetical protein